MGERVVDPTRGVGLELVHEICNRETRSQGHVQVHVIRRSTGAEQDRPLTPRDARQATVQTLLPHAVDPRLPAERAPDEMDPHPDKRVAHHGTLVAFEVSAPSFPRGAAPTIARRPYPRPARRAMIGCRP